MNPPTPNPNPSRKAIRVPTLMSVTCRTTAGSLLLAAWIATGALPAGAAGSARAPSEPTDAAKPAAYQRGLERVDAGDLAGAEQAFARADNEHPGDPEILNMLAFTQRKNGKLDRAIGTYKKALRIAPDFALAHEYLAEAYLQAVLRQIEILAAQGSAADAERAKIIRAVTDAAASLPPPPDAPTETKGRGW